MMSATCPTCGTQGRGVKEITLRSLVTEAALAELGSLAGFSFCASSGCDVTYFAADGRTVDKARVSVRIGVKETESPRPLCYCFGYAAEDLEDPERGSVIVDTITKKCREGLDRCPEKNPRGACCLGDVRRVAKGASGPDNGADSCCD